MIAFNDFYFTESFYDSFKTSFGDYVEVFKNEYNSKWKDVRGLIDTNYDFYLWNAEVADHTSVYEKMKYKFKFVLSFLVNNNKSFILYQVNKLDYDINKVLDKIEKIFKVKYVGFEDDDLSLLIYDVSTKKLIKTFRKKNIVK